MVLSESDSCHKLGRQQLPGFPHRSTTPYIGRPGGGRGEDHFSWDYWLERSILMTGWVQCRSEVRYRQKSRVNTPPTVYSYQNAKNVTFSTLEAALRCVHRRSIARPQPHSGFRGFWCDNAAIYPRWVSLLPLAQMARLDIKYHEGCFLPCD